MRKCSSWRLAGEAQSPGERDTGHQLYYFFFLFFVIIIFLFTYAYSFWVISPHCLSLLKDYQNLTQHSCLKSQPTFQPLSEVYLEFSLTLSAKLRCTVHVIKMVIVTEARCFFFYDLCTLVFPRHTITLVTLVSRPVFILWIYMKPQLGIQINNWGDRNESLKVRASCPQNK
jgi:hypothetical protein